MLTFLRCEQNAPSSEHVSKEAEGKEDGRKARPRRQKGQDGLREGREAGAQTGSTERSALTFWARARGDDRAASHGGSSGWTRSLTRE